LSFVSPQKWSTSNKDRKEVLGTGSETGSRSPKIWEEKQQ
jgi:hypothetical protein